MNFLGVGPIELIIIGLVAFIFLGPERMVDAARLLGRLTREVRKMTSEVRDMVDVDELTNPKPTGQAIRPDSQPGRSATSPSEEPTVNEGTADSGGTPQSDGPVSFKSARELHKEKVEKPAAEEDASPIESQEERA